MNYCFMRIATALALLTPLMANAAEIKHRALISGCGLGYIGIVNEDSKIEWKLPYSPDVSDGFLLKNGNIIHSSKTEGVREIKPDYAKGEGGEVVWQWIPETLPGKSAPEVHSCQMLPGDILLVGETHDGISYLREVDRKTKKIVKSVELTGLGGKHSSFRQVRKTKEGTYLITYNGGSREYDAKGKLLRDFPGGRYSIIRLPNKNTLIGCGDTHNVIEVAPDNKIVWEIKQNDLEGEGVKLGFVGGLQRLPNGNTVITNWGGHGGTKGPAVFEVTPDKKIVWKTPADIKNGVSSVQILDKNIINKEQLR